MTKKGEINVPADATQRSNDVAVLGEVLVDDLAEQCGEDSVHDNVG